MSYLIWGSLLLLVATLIYYAVFFVLIYYWHEKKATLVIVPLIYTFDFFIITAFLIGVGIVFLHYLPDILKIMPDILRGVRLV